MTKQFWAVLIVILAVLIGVFAFTGHKNSSSGGSSKVGLSNHVTGGGKKGVTLLEYGDYQCPYCQQYESTLEQVRQQYGQDIYFQFRNFPLTSVHPNAFAAARAVEAAALQDKFWQMHDALYAAANWQQWSTSNSPSQYFEQYAQAIGLNLAKFKQDFASDQVNAQINADKAEAERLGLTGTPSFLLDGKQVQIGNSFDQFKKVIDAEIAKKSPKTQQ